MRIIRFFILLSLLFPAPAGAYSFTPRSMIPALIAVPDKGSHENNSVSSAPGYEKKLSLGYDVYASGFKSLNASLRMKRGKKTYEMAVEAKTRGLIGRLFPWKTSMKTVGHIDKKGAPVPTLYTARNSWRKRVSVTEMSYDPHGKVLKMTTQDNGKTAANLDIDPALSDHTVDVLTGTLVMLQAANSTHACTGKFPVFDGKRRFNITLADDGTETLAPSSYSRFAGEAMRCILKVEPVAGFQPKDEKRGWMAVQNYTEARHKPPTLWLAKVKGSDQMIPVRMEIASDYGAAIAYLSSAGGT